MAVTKNSVVSFLFFIFAQLLFWPTLLLWVPLALLFSAIDGFLMGLVDTDEILREFQNRRKNRP